MVATSLQMRLRAKGPFLPETQALIARFTTPPTTERSALINALIGSLLTTGVWAKFDAFYVMAQYDAQAAQQNWLADQYNLTPISSPVFTTDRGYTGNGTTSYMQCGVNLDGLTQYQRDSAHLMEWVRTLPTNPGGASTEVGVYTGTDRARLRSTTGAGGIGNSAARVNQASTSDSAGTVTRGTGMILASRTGSSLITTYRNDDQSSTSSVASAALTSGALGLMRGVDGTYSNAEISVASFGAGLTTTDKSNLYAALNTYLAAVGAA